MGVTIESPQVRANPMGWADPVIERTDPDPKPSMVPLLVWCACLATATVLLLWLGAGRLATPSVTDPAAWLAWVRADDPAVVAMAALRVVALGLAWYLTGVTSIAVVARVLRAARLLRIADALAVGPARVLAQQALGAGLAAGVLVSAVPSAAPSSTVASNGTAGSNTSEVVDSPTTASASSTPIGGLPVVDDGNPAAPSAPGSADVGDGSAAGARSAAVEGAIATAPPATVARTVTAASPAVVAPPLPAPAAAAADMEVIVPVGETSGPSAGTGQRIVESGEHFWGIAEDELAAHVARPVTTAEVHAHWQRLVAANRDRLVVPGEPDLLLPGQRIVLPEVSR